MLCVDNAALWKLVIRTGFVCWRVAALCGEARTVGSCFHGNHVSEGECVCVVQRMPEVSSGCRIIWTMQDFLWNNLYCLCHFSTVPNPSMVSYSEHHGLRGTHPLNCSLTTKYSKCGWIQWWRQTDFIYFFGISLFWPAGHEAFCTVALNETFDSKYKMLEYRAKLKKFASVSKYKWRGGECNLLYEHR